jgi:HTH-type transcriptional regulator, transcriptional repressor of NAD biosynthesis genes
MALTVTLLGGESSGKTTLAHALLQALGERCIPSAWVPEHLRTWCERHGRAPQVHEQAARALAQSHAIETAAQNPATRVVLADTTALQIAAYSELYFNDRSLWPDAIDRQRRYGLSLLMGLDLPWMADGLFRDSPAHREATDALLRRELQAARIPFQTLYGTLETRAQQALRSIGHALDHPLVEDHPDWASGRRPWACDRCSEPDCEHRLFTQLLRQRPAERCP